MKDWISLEEYLNIAEDGDKYSYNGRKLIRNRDEKTICKNPPEFCVFKTEYDTGEQTLTCTVEVRFENERYNDIEYLYIREGKSHPTIKIEEDCFSDLFEGKWVRDKDEMVSLIKRYLKYNASLYYTYHRSEFFKCGWAYVDGKYQYKAVTYRNLQDCFILQEMFDKKKYFGDFDNAKQLSPNAMKIFDFLKSNRNLIIIFAYVVHSLVWDFKYEYDLSKYENALKWLDNKGTVFFSICLCGKDDLKSRVLANIILDLFKSPKNLRTISLNYHISATSIDSKIDRLRHYGSVPIIVTSKSNCIVKSSKIVKELDRRRSKGELYIYPAFISNKPINVDEMINVETMQINLPDFQKEQEEVISLHHGILEILYYFLKFLCNNKNNSNILQNIMKAKEDICYLLKQDDYWIQENLPFFLLYVALLDFSVFLDEIGLNEEATQLKQIYIEGFNCHDELTIQKQEEGSEQFEQYLLLIYEIIQSKDKIDWVKEGNEPRGDKERCYYLEADKWYDFFSAKVQKNGLPPIKKTLIVKKLYEIGILKTANTKTKGLKRNNHYYLTIIADQFDQLIDQA